MPETFAPILPGNWTIQANAYPLPNGYFKANKRPPGDPRDRNQQAVMFMPGWMAVHKVGYALVDGTTSKTALDVIIPSPTTRPDDKPLADVVGLVAPKDSLLYRVGLRVPPVHEQPGYYTSGAPGKKQTPPGPSGDIFDTGLVGTPGQMLALASAAPSAQAAGSISATAASTGTETTNPLTFGVDKRMSSAAVSFTEGFGLATDATEVLTADVTFKIYSVDDTGAAAGAAFASDLLGGVYLIAEICYLVPAPVADMGVLQFPGARYAGYEG